MFWNMGDHDETDLETSDIANLVFTNEKSEDPRNSVVYLCGNDHTGNEGDKSRT